MNNGAKSICCPQQQERQKILTKPKTIKRSSVSSSAQDKPKTQKTNKEVKRTATVYNESIRDENKRYFKIDIFFSMGLYFKGSHTSPYKATNDDDY